MNNLWINEKNDTEKTSVGLQQTNQKVLCHSDLILNATLR